MLVFSRTVEIEARLAGGAPMPYEHTKKECAGCGRVIAHTRWGTPRRHLCPHGKVCVHIYGLLGRSGGPGPGNHPKRNSDPRYHACTVCAEEWGWRPKESN